MCVSLMMVFAESIGLVIKCGVYAYIVIALFVFDVIVIESLKLGGKFFLVYVNSECNM